MAVQVVPAAANVHRPRHSGSRKGSRSLAWDAADEADGDTLQPKPGYSEALEVGGRLGEPSVTASALEGLARLALAAGDRVTAIARFAEAAGIRERSHRPAPPHERDDLNRLIHTPRCSSPMSVVGGVIREPVIVPAVSGSTSFWPPASSRGSSLGRLRRSLAAGSDSRFVSSRTLLTATLTATASD